jgi:hypothetical protein
MRGLVLFIALALGACATPPPPQIAGRYAAGLSTHDVQQITQVVAARPDLGRCIRKLEAVRPDRVHVQVERSHGPKSWSGSYFFVVRRGANWYFEDQNSIEAVTERTVTIY